MKQSAEDCFDAANACELDGRWSEANELYTKAIQQKPEFIEAFDNRACNWVLLGEYARAIADYQVVIDRWPEYAPAYCNLASALLDADDPAYANPKLALSYAQEACRLTANNGYVALATYARAFHACQEFDQAVHYQQLAVEVASQVRSSGTDPVDRIDAETVLPYLSRDLEQLRAEATAHRANKRTWLRRLLSLLKPSH